MTSFSRFSVAALVSVYLLACSCIDSDGPTYKTEDTGSETGDQSVDAGPVTPEPDTEDNSEKDTSVPDDIVASVDISLNPAYHVYAPESEVTTSAKVFDADGNEVDDPEAINWSVTPTGAAQKTGDSGFKFIEEGILTLEACATLDTGQEICGEKDVAVDGNRPTIQIDKPEPGAMLSGRQSDTIQVEGKVTDSHGNVTAFLNQQKISLDNDGKFSEKIEPDFGTNTIRVVANDGFNRADTTERRTVLWAPRYKKLGSDLKFSLSKGVGIDLGQNFFDDAEPPIRDTMDSELVTKDFADIIDLLVSNIDLKSQLPDPLIDSGGTRLKVDSVNLSDPDVMMDVTNDGVNLYLHIKSLILQTSGEATIEGKTLDLNGTVEGRISGYTSVGVEKPSPTESFEANVRNVDISLDEVNPNFADSEANAIFKVAEGVLRSKLEDRLVSTVRDEIVGTLPPLLTETLDSIENSLADQTLEFTSDLTGTRKVNFSGQIGEFKTAFRQSMFGVISNEVQTPGTDVYPSAPGIPLTSKADAGMPLFNGGRIQIAVQLGLLNGVITGLWKSGYLDIDLSNSLPSSIDNLVDEAKVVGKLPGVIRPANRSEPYDLVLETGQLEIEAKALGQVDTYGVDVRAGLDVSLKDNKLSISIPDDPIIDSWVINTTGDSVRLTPDDLNRLILNEVWPRIRKSLQGGLGLNLPAPDISQLQRIAPTLSNLSLSFVMERPLTVRNGYIIFDSALEGILPL